MALRPPSLRRRGFEPHSDHKFCFGDNYDFAVFSFFSVVAWPLFVRSQICGKAMATSVSSVNDEDLVKHRGRQSGKQRYSVILKASSRGLASDSIKVGPHTNGKLKSGVVILVFTNKLQDLLGSLRRKILTKFGRSTLEFG